MVHKHKLGVRHVCRSSPLYACGSLLQNPAKKHKENGRSCWIAHLSKSSYTWKSWQSIVRSTSKIKKASRIPKKARRKSIQPKESVLQPRCDERHGSYFTSVLPFNCFDLFVRCYEIRRHGVVLISGLTRWRNLTEAFYSELWPQQHLQSFAVTVDFSPSE